MPLANQVGLQRLQSFFELFSILWTESVRDQAAAPEAWPTRKPRPARFTRSFQQFGLDNLGALLGMQSMTHAQSENPA